MRYLRPALCLILWIAFVPIQAQDPVKWSLENCIDYALKNNITVLQSGLVAGVAQNDNLQSKLNFLPTIDLNASYNLNYGNSLNPVTYQFSQVNSQTGSAQIQGGLPLFTGLQQIHNVQRTKYELQASQYDYLVAQNNIALSVSSAFLQILLNKEILTVLEKQKALTAEQKASVESRVNSGLLPANTLYEIEAQLARDEANIVNARGVYNISVLTLKQLLQISGSQPFELQIPDVNADMLEGVGNTTAAGIFDYAVTTQPSIKGADARVKSADASRKIAWGAMSPTIYLYTALSTGYFSRDQKVVRYNYDTIAGIPITTPAEYAAVPFGDQLNNNFRKAIGFQLTVPLFGKGQKFTNVSNARLQLQIRKLQLEGAKNTLRQDIEQAYANAQASAESYFANKKGFEAAKKSFDVLEQRYKSGLANTFEVQQSKNTLAAAESEMARAKYTYVFRLKVLDFYQGKKITLGN